MARREDHIIWVMDYQMDRIEFGKNHGLTPANSGYTGHRRLLMPCYTQDLEANLKDEILP